jgi:hypothetical protein
MAAGTNELATLATKCRKAGKSSIADFAEISCESEIEAGVSDSIATTKWFQWLRDSSTNLQGA